MNKMRVVSVFVAVAILLLTFAACGEFTWRQIAETLRLQSDTVYESADGYLALAPAVLRPGHRESIPISLFTKGQPGRGMVHLSLLKDNEILAEGIGFIQGSGKVLLNVPVTPDGQYQFRIQGEEFDDTATLRVESAVALFIETDKPIYKPGQDVRMRVLRLDAELKPLVGDVTVEVQDAKGIKVYRQVARTDDFGMATLTMPLSTEPNLGVWKVTAHSDQQMAQLDVRVERYVLPKYEVDVNLPKEWVLADEAITGKVSAEYSFGKPVRGDMEIVASRYVGHWEEYATFSEEIDGSATFELPPVEYVAGVPAAGGQGNVRLVVTVREKSTGYVEKTTRLLTVAHTPVNVRLIAESPSFKPTLPMSVLLVTETPDNKPVDREVEVEVRYLNDELDTMNKESFSVPTVNGRALFEIEPPRKAVAVDLLAQTGNSYTERRLAASYSPSGSFVHVEHVGTDALEVGNDAQFRVHSTSPSLRFYYEVVSRGRVVFSDVSPSPDISVTLTPVMAPTSRLVVYQIRPDNEVVADYIPFDVVARYPMRVDVGLSSEQVRPGEGVDVEVTTDGPAKVGLVAVDRSVFILAENRLNLHQVFAELERLYMKPQVELHEFRPYPATTRGADETFRDAGLVVLSNMEVPEGEELKRVAVEVEKEVVKEVQIVAEQVQVVAEQVVAAAPAQVPDDLATVERVRQFFPETWLWTDGMTDDNGRATFPAEAPDSITTWMLRAVALSKEHGLGVGEAELRVFQPFFVQVDLPYSAVRGEEFPVKVALYNYLDSPQEFFVELEESEHFDLLDAPSKTVSVEGNDIGGVEFAIHLRDLGSVPLKVTARGRDSADAVVRSILVEPEGVQHEVVDNRIIAAGIEHEFDNSIPAGSIPGSARTRVALTGNYLSQTIEGLEGLLRMPFGCGEQNMILFAPNVFVARYLEETDQLKPEVMAKAERLMITGYQRELTYRRADGSFSAFGDSDAEGSLWLTAFVLKTFAQARDLIYVDEGVLEAASDWILEHQRPDGSFEPIGFLHHQELLGGLQGNNALTAYVAIALQEAGETASVSSAIRYLENQVGEIDDPYTMAIVSYALHLEGSNRSDSAHERLMGMAVRDGTGIYWGPESGETASADSRPAGLSAAVENTGYALLSLIERGELALGASVAKWLVSQRNAYGGYGSTQDTVVGLQALILFATHSRTDVNMTVTLVSGSWSKEVTVDTANADVVQIVEVPVGDTILLSAQGEGEVVTQVVYRFNRPEVEPQPIEVFKIDVEYSADDIEVDDLITVSAEVTFTPPSPIEAGMVVVDVSVPTGFAPVTDTVQQVVDDNPRVKRFDVAGRKVILYIEELDPNKPVQFQFDAVALYPVKAQPVTSQVYSYYNPHWRGETLGQSVIVK